MSHFTFLYEPHTSFICVGIKRKGDHIQNGVTFYNILFHNCTQIVETVPTSTYFYWCTYFSGIYLLLVITFADVPTFSNMNLLTYFCCVSTFSQLYLFVPTFTNVLTFSNMYLIAPILISEINARP